MECREQALKLFWKQVNNHSALSEHDRKQLTASVKRLARDSLNKLDKNCRFKYQEFMLVIVKTAAKGKLVLEKATEAFENLEKYFILLYMSPWKREFRKIKTFCGFFQSKIKSHLEDPESIFYLVGFRPDGHGTLTLQGAPNRQLFISVAFECVVASVECEVLSEHHRKLKESGASVADVVRWRDTGEMPELKKIHPKENSIGSKGDTVNKTYNMNTISIDYPHSGARNKIPTSVDLPYIDDEEHIEDTGYIEGTIDEHMMASMQRLSQSETRPKLPETPEGGAKDWDFVRTGLETKYGPKYYEGVRGDFMKQRTPAPLRMRRDDNSDEGIDVEEEPPAVNIHHPPMRAEPVPARSDNRTSGYHTGYDTNLSPVYYPPRSDLTGIDRTFAAPSGGMSSDTAYASGNRGFVRSRGITRNIPITRKSEVLRDLVTSDLMTRRMNDVGLASTETDTWACTTCTLENVASSKVCVSCGKSRFVGPEVDGPQCGDRTSVCQACTYENQPGDSHCLMCGAVLEKRNVHTYV